MNSSTVLLVGNDRLLIGDVTRLAAAAGVVPETITEPEQSLGAWTRAALVLVDAGVAGTVAQLKPPRRAGVHVLARGTVPDECFRDALGVGAETVAELPASETWLVELLTDVGDGAARVGTTVGVIGGAGGVGTSVFAAALALTASEDRSVLLVDADPIGAGIDRVLGMEQVDGIRWDSMGQSTGRLSGRSMRAALPQRGELSVLTWPADDLVGLQPGSMREVLSAGARGFDLVVVDLPRRFDAVLTEAMSRCDHLIVVAPSTVPGVAAAAKVARRLPGATTAHLLVRNQRGGVPAADVAGVLGLPLLGTLSDQRGLSEAIDLGAGPLRSSRGPIHRACRDVLSALVPVQP